jgi:2-polyprenyl-3-methyl-5-hydroxy-6-metoxy-1,4-benzoquinol methylase
MKSVYNKSYFDSYGKSGSSYGVYENNPTFKKRIEELKELGIKKGKILDIGCAYGYFLRACEARGFKTYGVDVSKHAISVAGTICTAELKVVDVEKSKLPFKNSNLDAIFLMDILEHLENPYKLLREVFRVLKRGGIGYLHVPVRSRAYADKTHKSFFTADSISRIMSFFPNKVLKIGEEGGNFSDYFALLRLLKNRNTYFNYVPKGSGSFVSAYFKKT